VVARRIRDARASTGAIEVGRRIATLRQRHRLFRVAFARQVGISRNTLLVYERGGWVPEGANLAQIGEIGGVSVDWLLGRDGTSPTSSDRGRGNRAWEAAIEARRVLWVAPRRRRVALDVLLALAHAPLDGLRRRP
jgi:transcriptional regulator with XRE-family HTH domain